MRNILLLAMSTLPNDIEKDNYYCYEGGETFAARSQLEPITHMLVRKRKEIGERLDKVIILETNQTAESKQGEKSAVGFYKERVGNFAEGIEYADISIDENEPAMGISEATRIILKEYEDNDGVNLWIDTQGGFRDVVMVFTAIISLLREQGIEAKGIYSIRFHRDSTKENPCPIIEQTRKYAIFKFVSAMQEFMDFGKATGFKEYYGEESEFVQVADKMAGAIQMCQPQKFEESLRKFAQYLNSGRCKNDDLYLQNFVEYMKEDYGVLLEEPDNIIEQIRWCVRKEFYQQAITIYIERIPKYYNDHGIVKLNVDSEGKTIQGKNLYAEAFYETVFDEMLRDAEDMLRDADDALNNMLNDLTEMLREENGKNASVNKVQKIKQFLNRELEKNVLSQNVLNAVDTLTKEIDERFDREGRRKNPEDAGERNVQKYINRMCNDQGKGRRYQLLYGEERKKEKTYVKKIRAIKEAKRKEPALVKYMEYYLAMKILRNRMNHANGDKIEEEELKAIEFLKSEQVEIGLEIRHGDIVVDYAKIKKLIIDGLECTN